VIQGYPFVDLDQNNTHCLYSKENKIISAKFNGTLESPAVRSITLNLANFSEVAK